jgi:hypothetical protein
VQQLLEVAIAQSVNQKLAAIDDGIVPVLGPTQTSHSAVTPFAGF